MPSISPTHFEYPPPYLPPNPIHETNLKLEMLSDNTAHTNQLLSHAAAEARKDGQETRWQGKLTNWLAAFSLVLLVLTSGWTFWEQYSDIKLRDLGASISEISEANAKRLMEINRANGVNHDELKAKILELENQIKQLKEVGELPPSESKE